MKNLLIIAQKVDAEDDLVGFFVGWIREFSKHFDRVFVITLTKGNYQLPKNVEVYSLGKERGNSKIARLFNFYKYLFQLVPKSSGIFAHMSPIFVVASWPIALIYRKKIILWYLHRSVTLRLKIAEKLCYKIVTAAKESLGFKSKKIFETGHGIDTEYFKPVGDLRPLIHGQVKILHVARISPAKRHEILIETAKILKEQGLDFKITIVGRPVMPGDYKYFEQLKAKVIDYRLQDMVSFAGFVSYSSIAEYYKDIDIAVNLTNGGTDKTVLEAMSAGCITITSNMVFAKYLGVYTKDLIFDYDDPKDLADKIQAVIILPLEKREIIRRFLSNVVFQKHSVSRTISIISSLLI